MKTLLFSLLFLQLLGCSVEENSEKEYSLLHRVEFDPSKTPLDGGTEIVSEFRKCVYSDAVIVTSDSGTKVYYLPTWCNDLPYKYKGDPSPEIQNVGNAGNGWSYRASE